MIKLDEKEFLTALHRIEDAIKLNCVDMRVSDRPGVVEGGFMRLHDKLDNINETLNESNEHLEVIARALRTIADKVGSM